MNLTFLSGIVVMLVILTVLILVHEAAHALAARLCGMRVTELFVGLPFGPRWVRRSQKSGIRYGISLALLGGYTKISGMSYEHNPLVLPTLELAQQRGTIHVADVATEFKVDDDKAGQLLDTLCDLGSLEAATPARGVLHGMPQVFQTVARDGAGLTIYDGGHDFSRPGSSQAGQAQPELQGTTASARLLEQDLSHTYQGANFWQRAITLLAGIIANLILAVVLSMAFYMIRGVDMPTFEVAGVSSGSLAESASIAAGDELLSLNGTPAEEGQAAVQAALAQALSGTDSFEVTYYSTSTGKTVSATLDPADSSTDSAGNLVFGITLATQAVQLGPLESLQVSWAYVKMVAQTIAQLLVPAHTMQVLDQSSGIIGIAALSGKAASAGIWDVISLMAALSLSLAFMNLLPFPPLDGGKLLIEILQALFRRKLSRRLSLIHI